MPSSSRARCGTAALHVVGVRELAERVPDELVDLDAEHLGERLVGVDDPAVVDAHERHAGRGRVERLLEPAPRLLECPRVLLALGQVAQTQHHPPLRARARSGSRTSLGASSRLRRCPSGLRARWNVASTSTDPSSPTRRTGAGSTISPAIARRQPARSSSRSAASTRSRKNERIERGRFDAAQLGRRRVGRQHAAFGVEQHHRLGQLVEESPHARLGGGHPGEALAKSELDPARRDVA